MDWRRASRPRGFGDATWRPGGAATAASPPRPAARPPARTMPATPFGAKFKAAPATTPPKAAAKLPRPYTPSSGGTIPDIFLPKFGAKIAGKGKANKNVAEVDTESIKENLPDTTPPISLDNTSSLYDFTDNTDASVPVSTTPDSTVQRDGQHAPPMFTTDFIDPPLVEVYESETDVTDNKPKLITQPFEEDEEDYSTFVTQQESMMQRAQKAIETHHNSLVDYEPMQKKQVDHKAAPFGDYRKNRESESEAFYTPNVSTDTALNKEGKKGEANLARDDKVPKRAKTIDPNRTYDVKGSSRRNNPMVKRSPTPGNENADEKDEEFLSGFSEQSVRTSAVFIPQKYPMDLDDQDSASALATQEREWQTMKGRKELSPLPFAEVLDSKRRESKSLKMRGVSTNEASATKESKPRGMRKNQSDSESLEDTSFRDSKVKNRDTLSQTAARQKDLLDSKGRNSKTPTKIVKQRRLQDDDTDEQSAEDELKHARVKGREAGSPTEVHQRASTDNKGRRSVTPNKMNAEIMGDGGRTKPKKRHTTKDNENDGATAKRNQYKETQESRRNRQTDDRMEDDSASEDSVKNAEKNIKKKGIHELRKKKWLSSDDDSGEARQNTSQKMKKGGSQKTSSRSTTPSKLTEVMDSHSEESDAIPKSKNKYKLQYSNEDTEINKTKPRAGQKPHVNSRKMPTPQTNDDVKRSFDTATRKRGTPVKEQDHDGVMSKSKGKSARNQKNDAQDLIEDARLKRALERRTRSKGKSQIRKHSPSYSPAGRSSEDDTVGIQSKGKKHVRQPSSDVGSSESPNTDGDEGLVEQTKVQKGFHKQTMAAEPRSPARDSDTEKVSTSASVIDPKLTSKAVSDDERTRSSSSAEESREHKSRQVVKGKHRHASLRNEKDSMMIMPGGNVMKRAQNELLETSSESNISLKDEDLLSDDTESAVIKKYRKQNKVVTTSDERLPSEKAKHNKRSKSKSPPQWRRSSIEDTELEPVVKKRGHRDATAAVHRNRSPGRKLVSDDSLTNVLQKVEKQSRRIKHDTSSFPSSDQTATELDEEDSLVATKTKAKKGSEKGTKGKIREQLLTKQGTDDKLSKSHGKKKLKAQLIPAEPKSKKNSKDTSPKTVSRDKSPRKQTILKAATEDTKVKHKSKDTTETLALKKKSENESSETSGRKNRTKSSSSSEEERDQRQSHEKKVSVPSRKKKSLDKVLNEIDAELLKSKVKSRDKGSGELSEKNMKPVKAFSAVPSNIKKGDGMGIENKTFPIKMQTMAFEQQASEASIFASQYPNPAPGAMTQTSPSLSRKVKDEEAGVQSEDFVNLVKQRLPTTSSAAAHRQFSPQDSLPQFRESLRKFLSKDVQTPVAKRIQTTPSIGLSEESVTWEEYSTNIMPKYTEKAARDRDKKHSKSIGVQQSISKLESDDSTAVGPETSESNVRHSWLDDVLKQLQSIAEDKPESSAGESSPDDQTQPEVSEMESLGGYSLYRGTEDSRAFQYEPCSDTSFDTQRRPTEESVYSKIPQASSIATVCPDPDKFVQVINISMLPSRIVAVEVTQDIGDGTTHPTPPGKLEFDEPITALTFNVPLLEPCQGDHHPVTNQHGKAWPQASTRHPSPVNMSHDERMRKSVVNESSMKRKESPRSGSGRRQRGASTRHQHVFSADENPRQQRPEASKQRNQLSPADILLSCLAQRLAWKPQ